jgi:hypothetical protein
LGPRGRKKHGTGKICIISSSKIFIQNIIQPIRSNGMRWAGHVACKGEKRHAYGALEGRPLGRKPLEKCMRRWEDNVKRDLKKRYGWAWTELIWLRIRTSGRVLSVQ